MSLDQFGPLEEKRGRAFHVVSEANGVRSREVKTIKQGEDLVTATVLGRITAEDKYVEWDPSAGDGSEDAAAVLLDKSDATAADRDGVVHIRDCELDAAEVVFNSLASGPEIVAATAQLEALGIILR